MSVSYVEIYRCYGGPPQLLQRCDERIADTILCDLERKRNIAIKNEFDYWVCHNGVEKTKNGIYPLYFAVAKHFDEPKLTTSFTEDFISRYNQGDFGQQRMGQAFINELTMLGINVEGQHLWNMNGEQALEEIRRRFL